MLIFIGLDGFWEQIEGLFVWEGARKWGLDDRDVGGVRVGRSWVVVGSRLGSGWVEVCN